MTRDRTTIEIDCDSMTVGVSGDYLSLGPEIGAHMVQTTRSMLIAIILAPQLRLLMPMTHSELRQRHLEALELMGK